MDVLFKLCALVAFFGPLQCQSDDDESEIIDVDWCDRESRKDAPHGLDYTIKNPVYYRARPGEGADACYFQVEDATEQVNTKWSDDDGRTSYMFLFRDARGICRKYSATLPTIRSKRELDFVKRSPTTWGTIALGAELTYVGKGQGRDGPNIVQSIWRIERWDDGVQGIDIFPNELASIPLPMDPEYDAARKEVVCKQNLTKFNSLRKTTTQRVSVTDR